MRALRNSGIRLPQALQISLVFLFVVLVSLLVYAYRTSSPGTPIGLGEVNRLADAGRIIEARLLDEDAQVFGRSCSGRVGGGAAPAPSVEPASRTCEGREGRFHAAYPRSDVATQALIERISRQSPLTVDRQSAKAVAKQLATFLLPLLILANLFALIFLSKGGDSALDEIVSFGKLGGKRARQRQASTGVSFANVAGADETVAELREVIDYLGDPGQFEAFGAAPPKGVMLFGPPGCGKTLVARAVAGESGVPFLSISGTEFVESLVGVGAARVRDLFAQVRAIAPAIVFIDEIDAVGRRREGEGVSGGEREQTLNQLLVEMDGFDVSSGIVVMGATNRPDILDPALLRPGRFDRHVHLEPPDVAGRVAILEVHARTKPMADDVYLAQGAARTPGFTGADLANVINEATLLAIRQGPGSKVGMVQLTEATQRVLHGPRRRGWIMSPAERRRIAYHECGHAVVAAALGRRDDVARVSVVARGRGLGQSSIADSERVLLTTADMAADLATAMGGIAAEQLVLGDGSTTSDHDIGRANDLAREMVGRYGMSSRMGWLRVLSSGSGDYLSNGHGIEAVSGTTLAELDTEVRRLLNEAQATALEALTANRAHLESMVVRLEESETLEGAALAEALAGVAPLVAAAER
ncbi:MAG: ATP-dependent metallopeptidase FtsH/Yme1/Tma family protein [Acidimicrobiales bacterium]